MTVKTFNSNDAANFLYKEVKDDSIQDRIRFFNFRSFPCLGEGTEFYSFLMDGKKVIGIAHVGYYSLNAKHERDWSISFLSIDKDYRYKGYSKLLVKEVFSQAKKRNLDISTSTYTVLGKEHLQKQFNEISQEYGVTFHDKPDDWGLMDAEFMYVVVDGKKFHKDEL